jgi:hypothetical protein
MHARSQLLAMRESLDTLTALADLVICFGLFTMMLVLVFIILLCTAIMGILNRA